jgi:hypothetical protein
MGDEDAGAVDIGMRLFPAVLTAAPVFGGGPFTLDEAS